ncbi:MAG: 6,7-dimethyl-8-ribityllumazine synthase [Acidimicrobiia bacterium]
MGTYRGATHLDATDMRIGVVVAQYNHDITQTLLDSATEAFTKAGGALQDLVIAWVPGAFEIPLIARRLAQLDLDAVVTLGAVIRGDTPHFDYVAGECARGVQQVALECDLPVIFGVLTTESLDQATARIAGGTVGDKGAEAMESAMAMVSLLRHLEDAKDSSIEWIKAGE